MHKDIEDLIKSNGKCVLATVSGMSPHCSLMSYASSDDCREIYLVTQKNTKKYRNMKENPDVSLLVDSREANRQDTTSKTKALTVTGQVESVEAGEKKEFLKKRILATHPRLHDFLDQTEVEILIVTVKAVQLQNSITETYFETIT